MEGDSAQEVPAPLPEEVLIMIRAAELDQHMLESLESCPWKLIG